jgi:hypothetical protein
MYRRPRIRVAIGSTLTDSRKCLELGAKAGSVLQRDYCLIAATEGRHMLQVAVWLFHQHDWTVAENRMTGLRHIPHTARTRMVSRGQINRRGRRGRELGPRYG